MALIASFLTTHPYIAGLVAMVFLAIWHWRKLRIALVTACLWLSYACYEYTLSQQLLCRGGCNIRMDLLLIYPLLIGLSLYTVIRFFMTKPFSS